MHRISARVLTAAALLLAASAAHAGTVYVPLPGISSVGGATYEVQVAIANDATAQRTVKQFQIANDSDGAQRGSEPTTLQVLAKRTVIVKPAATFRGLLELSSGTELQYAARLAQTGGVGVDLPVVSSDNLVTGGDSLALQGLTLTTTRVTDVTIVNLAKDAAQCTVALTRSDGTAIGAQSTLSVKALSSRALLNVFSGLIDAATGVTDARATVSCTRGFFALAVISDSASGDLTVVGPSGSGRSTLLAPGEEPACTAQRCFEVKGLVHKPTPAVPVKRVSFDAPAGTFSRVRFSMDVKVGPWYPQDPSGKHMLYWLVVNKNVNMIGTLFFRGPSRSLALARHGIGLVHADKLRIEKPFAAQIGKTYHIEQDYDMGLGSISITIKDVANGQTVVSMNGVPNVRSLVLKSTDDLVVDIGLPEGKTPDEVPSYDWEHSNLKIELFQ